MLETVKIFLNSAVEMHHQLQYLNTFAENSYLKKAKKARYSWHNCPSKKELM